MPVIKSLPLTRGEAGVMSDKPCKPIVVYLRDANQLTSQHQRINLVRQPRLMLLFSLFDRQETINPPPPAKLQLATLTLCETCGGARLDDEDGIVVSERGGLKQDRNKLESKQLQV